MVSCEILHALIKSNQCARIQDISIVDSHLPLSCNDSVYLCYSRCCADILFPPLSLLNLHYCFDTIYSVNDQIDPLILKLRLFGARSIHSRKVDRLA